MYSHDEQDISLCLAQKSKLVSTEWKWPCSMRLHRSSDSFVPIFLEFHPQSNNGMNYHCPVCFWPVQRWEEETKTKMIFSKYTAWKIFTLLPLTSHSRGYINLLSHKNPWEMMSIAHYNMPRQNSSSETAKTVWKTIMNLFQMCMHQLSIAV